MSVDLDPTEAPRKPHYTLEAFNEQQAQMYARLAESRRSHPNNIACPNCGAELWDVEPIAALHVNPATIDPLNPPQQQMRCQVCMWQGLRLA